MPLPKSSSTAAKATEVYSEVWSVLLQQVWMMPPTREDDLAELSRLLPYLRQLLTCCACAGLLEDAVISLSCGHCYCSECQFRDPLLKIQCRQCRDRTGLVAESQLRIVVKCYRHMCSILADKVLNNPALFKLLSNTEKSDKETEKSPALESDENKMPVKKGSQKSNSVLNTDTENNPIVEILREIQEGTKVSRSVLVVKPPQKYLTPKSLTPKKDQQNVSSTSKLSLDSHSEVSQECNMHVPTRRDCKSVNSQNSHSSTLVSHRISTVKGKRKRGTAQRGLAPEEHARKRQRRVKNTVVHKREVSTEEDEDVDIISLSNAKLQANELDMLQGKLALDRFKPDVALSCLDEQFLNVSLDGVTLKQSTTLQADNIARDFEPNCLRYRESASGERERIWDPMCPRVRPRRSRAIIDKTIMQQVRTARGLSKPSKPKETRTPQPPAQPRLAPPPQLTPPIAPHHIDNYEPPLPDDLSGLVLEKLEGEDPLPYIDRLLFRPPPMYPPPPFPHHPLPPPPPFVHRQPPIFGSVHPDPRYPLLMPPIKPTFPPGPIPKTPPKPPKSASKSPSTTPKKRRTPGYSEDGWRCRCGTNNVMFPEKVCAKGKCPCYSKGIPCKNCLCKHCHNPNNK